MDGVRVWAGLFAQDKAYNSARDCQPSGNLGAWARETGKKLSYWVDPKIKGFMGGVPIEFEGKVIGAIVHILASNQLGIKVTPDE